MASNMPKELNEGWASNLLLDGFQHDMDYGAGIRERYLTEMSSSVGNLPDGIVTDTSEPQEDVHMGGVLEDLTALNIVASALETPLLPTEGVVDHTWLSDATQDPNRLPHQMDVLTQLQHLWGTRTDGIFRVPAQERVIVETQEDPPTNIVEPSSDVAVQAIEPLLRSAMRLASSGKSVAAVLQPRVGEKIWEKLRPLVAALEKEKGLLGTVYLYASAYPRLHLGQWSKSLKTHSRNATFLVSPSTRPEDVARIEGATGLRVVSSVKEIPWVEECWRRTGVEVASVGEAKRAIKAHYEPKTVSTVYHDGIRLPQTHPMDRVTRKEAEEALQNYRVPAVEIRTIADRVKSRMAQESLFTLKRWVKAGQIAPELAESLSKLGPQEALRRAAQMMVEVQKRQYKGFSQPQRQSSLSDEALRAHLQEARDVLRNGWAQQAQIRLAKEAQRDFSRRSGELTRMVRQRMLPPHEAERLMGDSRSTREVLREAAEIAAQPSRAGSFTGSSQVVKAREVSHAQIGHVLRRSEERTAQQKKVVEGRVLSKELKQKALWVQRVAERGLWGKEFVAKVASQLTPEDTKALWPYIGELVKKQAALSSSPSQGGEYSGHRNTGHVLQSRASEVLQREAKSFKRRASDGESKLKKTIQDSTCAPVRNEAEELQLHNPLERIPEQQVRKPRPMQDVEFDQ